MYYTGCDPGMQGAISTLTKEGDVLFLGDLPMKGRWYDPHALMLMLNLKEQVMGLEESYRFPKLCKGIGIIWTCAQLSPKVKQVHMIQPRQWQRFHGIRKADKNVSIEIARHLFPGRAKELTLKKHHNRAESLLITDYVRRGICHITK